MGSLQAVEQSGVDGGFVLLESGQASRWIRSGPGNARRRRACCAARPASWPAGSPSSRRVPRPSLTSKPLVWLVFTAALRATTGVTRWLSEMPRALLDAVVQDAGSSAARAGRAGSRSSDRRDSAPACCARRSAPSSRWRPSARWRSGCRCRRPAGSDSGRPWRAIRSCACWARSTGSGKRATRIASSRPETLFVEGIWNSTCGYVRDRPVARDGRRDPALAVRELVLIARSVEPLLPVAVEEGERRRPPREVAAVDGAGRLHRGVGRVLVAAAQTDLELRRDTA